MFQHALLNEIIAFVAVADHNSFTRAAEHLQTTKSSVGKAIQKLEDALSVKLFHRSTRSVRLTEEGYIYLNACRQALDAIADAKAQFASRQTEPAGKLRVNSPIGIGRAILQSLSDFTSQYPQIIPEIVLSDKFEETVEGDWDVVIRIGELADSALIARKLCHLKTVLCASPGYLAKFSTPRTPGDLPAHKSVVFRAPNGRLRPWFFKDGENHEAMEYMPTPSAIFSDGRALVDAAIEGIGMAQIYDKSAIQALGAGQLIELLPELATQGPPMHALIMSGREMPPKTRVFVDFVQTLFSDQ